MLASASFEQPALYALTFVTSVAAARGVWVRDADVRARDARADDGRGGHCRDEGGGEENERAGGLHWVGKKGDPSAEDPEVS